MVLYNKKNKYKFKKCESFLELEEHEMINEKLSYNEYLAFKVLELSFNIEAAIRYIENSREKFNELSKYIEVLNEWKLSKKEEIFDSIIFNYISSIENNIKVRLVERIDSYIEYIELIQSEEDELDKYEELSKVIIQIPSKIHYYLEQELKLHNQKLIRDSVLKQDNKKTSSNLKMSFCCDIMEIDILAA